MNNRRLISVVIPTYNRADYLTEAVESALGQKDVDVDVIVVDDGSTDDTASLIEHKRTVWGDKVRYVWQKNSERSIARNHGLQYARGTYVAFLDSDDIWRQEHAITCIRALEADKEAIAAYSEYGLISADGGVIRDMVRRPPAEGKTFQVNLCLKRLILHPTEVVLRRSMLGKSEVFDPEITAGEDWLVWVELSKKGSFRQTGKATVWMRLHPRGTFGDPQKFTRGLMLAAEKVIATHLPEELGVKSDRILAINRTHCAYAHYLSGNQSEAWKWLRLAVRKYSWTLKEADFWKVFSRLCVGPRLSKRIRAMRQRPTNPAKPVPRNSF